MISLEHWMERFPPLFEDESLARALHHMREKVCCPRGISFRRGRNLFFLRMVLA